MEGEARTSHPRSILNNDAGLSEFPRMWYCLDTEVDGCNKHQVIATHLEHMWTLENLSEEMVCVKGSIRPESGLRARSWDSLARDISARNTRLRMHDSAHTTFVRGPV